MLSSSSAGNASLNLRSKFVLAVSLLVLIAVATVVAFEVYWVRNVMTDQTVVASDILADTIATTAGYYVIFDLRDDLKGIAAGLERQESIAYADFLGADANVLAATPNRKLPPAVASIKPGREPVSESVGDLHVFIRPVFEAGATDATPRGWFRLVVNEDASDKATGRFILSGVLISLVMLGVAIVLAIIGSQRIVGPVQQIVEGARRLAAGDLTHRSDVRTDDELGVLSTAFNEMAGKLEQTVAQVIQSNSKLAGASETVGRSSRRVLESADEQRALLDDTYASIDELNGGIRRISGSVEDLSASSEQTSSSILQMVASIEEVSRNTDTLFSSVEETSSATTQMVASINEVDQNVEFLRSFLTDTSASMVEMSTSISQVQANAARSYDLSVGVSEAASEGMVSVRETIDGMERIRASTSEASAVVARLGDRSAEIGKILNVIEDVAEQTNLLALNAAILAAQAGEHGKGFSVVAGQIRQLSERTANSTRDIASLINSVQEEVSTAIVTMSEGAGSVESGVRLAHEAGKALNRILESANSAAEAGREIANATRDQAKGSENITHSVEKVQDMVGQINAATRQQTAGSQHILSALESMREVARYVQQAMIEQRSGSQMISKASERMIEKVHEILDVTEGQTRGSDAIVKMMEKIRSIAEQNRKAAGEMSNALDALGGAMRSLDDEVRQFRARG